MKTISKRILCILTSLMMLLPLMCVGVSAEVPTTYVFDANDYQVNNVHTAILNLPSWLVYDSDNGSAAAKPKVYKQTDILGLTDGESAIEFVAREDRVNTSRFEMQDVEFEADGDFYITMNFYLGDARDNDFLVVNGQYSGYKYDGSAYAASKSDINSRMYMRGTEQIASNPGGGNNWATYEKGNWYRYTLAAKAKNDGSGGYEMTAYIDDTDLTQYYNNSVAKKNDSVLKGETDGNIIINAFGFATGRVTNTSGLGGKPQWWLLKDMQLVKGTYNPADTSTAIETTEYTVQLGSFVRGDTPKESFVTGVPANTSVSEFLGNITVPTGATKKVVKIAEDNLATTVVGDGETVTSAMKLLVTTADGSMKLYDIDAAVGASLLPSVSSNANYPAYVVDAAAKKISIPDTTVAKLKERITLGEGTTVKVVDANGYEVADTKTVTNTMKLVASKNNNDVEYALEITKNLEFYGALSAVDTVKIGYTYDSTSSKLAATSGSTNGKISPYADSGSSSILYYDVAGKSVTPVSTSSYTLVSAKIPNTEILSYKTTFTDFAGWAVHHSRSSKYHVETATQAAMGYDKLVVEYDMQIEDGAAAYITKAFCTGANTEDNTADQTGFADSLGFKDGKIYIGAGLAESTGLSGGTEIGTYTEGKPFKIAMVQEAPDGETPGITIEAIYVDDVKVFPLAEKEHNGTMGTTVVHKFHSFSFYSHGTVYWGKVNVYKADNYALPEAAAAEADLKINSNAVTIEDDRIYGWEDIATVADLKDVIDSAATTEVEVLNIIGSAALAETVALENGMLFRVTDKNHPENTAYYVLAKTTTDSGTTVTVNGDKITATRQVFVYTAESASKSMTIILAVYEGDTLKTAKLDTKTIQAIGDYDFEVEIEDYDPETMSYKAFAWNLGTLVPYEGITQAQ